MDDPIVAFFTNYAIDSHAGFYDMTHLADLDSNVPSHSSKENTPGQVSGIHQRLFHLLRQVLSLNFGSKTKSISISTIISEATRIWHDLDSLTTVSGTSTMDTSLALDKIHEKCAHSLFLWLNCILYPDNVGGAKIQKIVTGGLVDIGELRCSESSELMLIPVFLYGVASIGKYERGIVSAQFDKLEGEVRPELVEKYRQLVQWTWRRYDDGCTRSWDWTDADLSRRQT
jgi:hypothetical protein